MLQASRRPVVQCGFLSLSVGAGAGRGLAEATRACCLCLRSYARCDSHM